MDNAPLPFDRASFGEDFLFGVSTAAFQIEGSHDADGKGPSIWDDFTSKRGRIKNRHHAQIACDFYTTYKNDVGLIKELGIDNFRFSVSWPRVMPSGEGAINPKGFDYYKRLADCLLECGITPWATLYHWDLPLALEQKGGWANRDSIAWFSEYTGHVAKELGSRIGNWMVMNEPSVFTGAGYFLGIHAPGRRGLSNYLKAVHHVTLATAAGARVLRSELPDATIGTTFSLTHIEPASSKEKDIAAAKRTDVLLNRTFIEPLLGLGYPQDDLSVLRKIDRYRQPEDDANMAFDFDFIGLQCYTREIVKASLLTPYIGASIVKALKRNVPHTEMGWEVHPPSIYHLLKRLGKYEGIRKIIVTENGAAFPDAVENGKVHDPQRTAYLRDHLQQVLLAKNEGVNVDGYFVWSLMDNFEWAEGYHPRFGLVYVDFETQQRIVKDSGHCYSSFLKGNVLK